MDDPTLIGEGAITTNRSSAFASLRSGVVDLKEANELRG